MKTLIIAEKPSVAAAIADALGDVPQVDDNVYENERYIISSAVGHLLKKVERTIPEEDGWRRWTPENLRLISPKELELLPIKGRAERQRLDALTRLYRRKDVGDVINACDAEREGELIFHYIMSHIGGKKPVRRAWLMSLADEDVRSAFDERGLLAITDKEGLLRAAICRADADQTIGFNASPALSALFGDDNSATPVGRVQTPTLAFLVKREREREVFLPRAYWKVHAELAGAADMYSGVWSDGEPGVAAREYDSDVKPDRIFDQAKAEAIIADCAGRQGYFFKEVKEVLTSPPPLFNLISLQREANQRYGMSAKKTLKALQLIYAEKKMATYPRTESRHLPRSYVDKVKETMKELAKDKRLGEFAVSAMKGNQISADNTDVFNNAKVGGHFAIIPTGENHTRATALEGEADKIYDMICRRFIAAFLPPAKRLVTERCAEVECHFFLAKEEEEKDVGWRAVEPDICEGAGAEKIAPISEESGAVTVAAIEKEERATQRPARCTEAELLSAMESAGGEPGLGTPATRAAIIEELIKKGGYLIRVGRELIPTWKADDLMLALAYLEQGWLADAEMTAKWEHALRGMENGEGGDEAFMQDIEDLCQLIIEKVREVGKDPVLPDLPLLTAPCPGCGGKVRERLRRFCCDSGECRFNFRKDAARGRKLSAAEVETLLTNHTTGILSGFIVRGQWASGEVVLNKVAGGRWRASFNPEGCVEEDASEIVGDCPKEGCGGKVRAGYGRSMYVCDLAEDKKGDPHFSLPRRLMQREMTPTEVAQLLAKGKTCLLEGFVSKKPDAGSPFFKARIKINLAKEKGWSFEYPPSDDREQPGGGV